MLIPAHQAGEEATILEKVRRGEGVDHYETQRLAKDGRLVDIALTVSPINLCLGTLKLPSDFRNCSFAPAARMKPVKCSTTSIKNIRM